MRKIALVTGATSGIGKATASVLALNEYDIIITGRREDRLDFLVKELREETGAMVLGLCFDVRSTESVEKAIDSLPEKWKLIDLLVNNAGLAVGLGPVHQGITEDWDRMIDTNLKGLLYVTRKVSAGMVERKKGHIINISSIAGKEAYPNGAAYCASKFGVQAITRAQRIELLPYGIKVSSICPGMAETEFSLVRFKGDQEKAAKVYEGLTPLYAEDIAQTILFMVTRPAHVNIDDILIMATDQGSARDFNRRKE